MKAFVAEHSVRSHSFTVALPVSRAFTLFEPDGERAWAEGWDPEYLHPADGKPQRGMAFRTGHGGEETLWLMTRHEPHAGIVEYQRVTPGSRMGSVLVQCAPLGESRTRVTVAYALTGLSEDGNRWLRAMDDEKFRAFVGSWERAIAATTGPTAG